MKRLGGWSDKPIDSHMAAPTQTRPRKIFGYNATASQPYAFEVLAGKYPAKGRNPYGNLYAKMRPEA